MAALFALNAGRGSGKVIYTCGDLRQIVPALRGQFHSLVAALEEARAQQGPQGLDHRLRAGDPPGHRG